MLSDFWEGFIWGSGISVLFGSILFIYLLGKIGSIVPIR